MDGIASAVITRRALGDGVGVAYAQPGHVPDALELFAQWAGRGRRLLVADLSLQKEHLPRVVHACTALSQQGWRVEWRDHHHKQWEGLDLAPLRAALDVLEVNADATESGASLQQKALAPDDVVLAELAQVVRDRDLWWNKDPRSEQLEFALGDLGPKRFEEALMLTTAGILTATLTEAAQRERETQATAKAQLLGATRYFGPEEARVGVVYGWLPRNTGLHDLLEDHGCHVAVNVRPNGKMSLRSRKDRPVCHLVAQQFGGGGHPNASGGDLGLRGWRKWAYVLRRGKAPVVDAVAERAVELLRTSST